MSRIKETKEIIRDYQNKQYALKLATAIKQIVNSRPMRLMEVCGTHTNAFFRFGLYDLLPDSIEVLSGPGCPVCVTPNSIIDTAIAYSRKEDIIIATFGDMMKVPGSDSSLAQERAEGAQIKIVYSPLDALTLAESQLEKKIIFIGIGFETTAPGIASAVMEASKRRLRNFYLLSAVKILPPVLEALLGSGELRLDGLICPGHVSVITGAGIYRPLADKYHIPCVVAGFEPVDILKAIRTLCTLIVEDSPSVVNEYRRVVSEEGNLLAQRLIDEIFEPEDSEWRGIGVVPGSGLRLKQQWAESDAQQNVEVLVPPPRQHPQCICGAILRGVKRPTDCPLFATVCHPANPIGACMVSSEGNCAIYYKYGIK